MTFAKNADARIPPKRPTKPVATRATKDAPQDLDEEARLDATPTGDLDPDELPDGPVHVEKEDGSWQLRVQDTVLARHDTKKEAISDARDWATEHSWDVVQYTASGKEQKRFSPQA